MTIYKGTTLLAGGSTYRPNIFDIKWSDHIINDIQWLRSDTFSWQSGSVYTTAYNELLSEYNNASSTTETDVTETYESWTRPNLTANGTMGGTSFACEASGEANAYPAWKAFSGDKTTYTDSWFAGTTGQPWWLSFYNPIPLKVTNLAVTNYSYASEDVLTSGKILASNDNTTWTELKSYTNSVLTAGATWNIDLSDNNTAYKYYRITIETINSGNGPLIQELEVTATQQTSINTVTYKRTPKGYKIADSTQETSILNAYTSSGVAWYYILDTTNTQFKLPRTKYGFEGLRDNVGNKIDESLPNITGSFGTIPDVNFSGSFSKGEKGSWFGYGSGDGYRYYVEFSANNSSSTYQDNAPVQERATQMYLYFYVGEYTQTAIEQTAGITSEQLNNKADKSDFYEINPMITSYVNGTSGYNIWANGYCEQWGRTTVVYGTGQTISLTKTYSNMNYTVLLSSIYSGTSTSTSTSSQPFLYYLSASSFKILSGGSDSLVREWRTCGYLADGEY